MNQTKIAIQHIYGQIEAPRHSLPPPCTIRLIISIYLSLNIELKAFGRNHLGHIIDETLTDIMVN